MSARKVRMKLRNLVLTPTFLLTLIFPLENARALETLRGSDAAEVVLNGQLITSTFMEQYYDWELLVNYKGRIYHCRVEPGFNPGQIAAMCAT